MRWQTFMAGIAGLLITGYTAGSATASIMYNGPFTGQDVTYSNIVESSDNPSEDPEPLFGQPAISPPNSNNLQFDTAVNGFSAEAPPVDITDGFLKFMVESNDGGFLNDLTIEESGDYSLAGATPSSGFVQAALNATIRDSDDPGTVLSEGSTTFVETFTAPQSKTGNWHLDLNAADFDTPLDSLGVDSVIVSLDNTLQTNTTPDTSATFIKKKDFRVNFTTVPEPASLALLGLGGLLIGCGRVRNS